MIATRMNFAVALAFAVMAAGAAVYAFTARQREREARAATERERDDLQTRLKTSEQAVAAAHERLTQARARADTLQEDLRRLFPASGGASAGGPISPAAAAPWMLSATTPPTVRPLPAGGDQRYGSTMFVAGRYRGPRTSFLRSPPSIRSLDTLYPALYRQLKLSAEQAAQFKALAIGVADRFSDLDRRARAEQKRPNDPALQPLYHAVDAEYREKLVALVGADALPVVEQFAETLVLRDAVGFFAGELFYTETPLTPAQADRLVEVMSKYLRDPNGRLDTVFADGSAMKTAPREWLAPAQLAAWNTFIDDLARTNFGALQPRPGSGMTTR